MVNEFLGQFDLSRAQRNIAVEILSTGLQASEIAEDMNISTATVKNHCYAIYKATESFGRSDFQALYIQFLENKYEKLLKQEIGNAKKIRRQKDRLRVLEQREEQVNESSKVV